MADYTKYDDYDEKHKEKLLKEHRFSEKGKPETGYLTKEDKTQIAWSKYPGMEQKLIWQGMNCLMLVIDTMIDLAEKENGKYFFADEIAKKIGLTESKRRWGVDRLFRPKMVEMALNYLHEYHKVPSLDGNTTECTVPALKNYELPFEDNGPKPGDWKQYSVNNEYLKYLYKDIISASLKIELALSFLMSAVKPLEIARPDIYNQVSKRVEEIISIWPTLMKGYRKK